MLERVIENWLDKASEKSFQVPFCFILVAEGHTIIHITRHAAMEYGKDIITIDPQGDVCAFQLKGAPGGRIGLAKFSSEIQPQLLRLTTIPVAHPSINDNTKHHKSFFVTNGYLEEEVSTAIALTNLGHERTNLPQYQVKTILRDELLERAKNIKSELLPSNLKDFNLFLELYLSDGGGLIDKDKIALLLSHLYGQETLKLKDKRETIAATAIVIGILSSNYSNLENHISLVEIWTLFLAHTYQFIERHSIEKKFYKQEIEIAYNTIISELDLLFEELKAFPLNVYPSGPEGHLMHNAKTTWLAGFLSFLGIYHKKIGNDRRAKEIVKYLEPFPSVFEIYGEAAFASILNYYWLRRILEATTKPTTYLMMCLNSVIVPVSKKYREAPYFFPNPYYSLEECIINRYSTNKPIENTKMESHYGESFLHLIVRENLKQFLKLQWGEFSRLRLKRMEFATKVDFYNWRNFTGDEITVLQRPNQDWNELREQAASLNTTHLPETLVADPLFMGLFLMVYPHRADPDMIKYFETWVRKYETIPARQYK